LPLKKTLFSRRQKHSSSRSKTEEDIILLDANTEDDEEISFQGETFVEENWLQLTEQDNSNTCSYAVVIVHFKENRHQILLHIWT